MSKRCASVGRPLQTPWVETSSCGAAESASPASWQLRFRIVGGLRQICCSLYRWLQHIIVIIPWSQVTGRFKLHPAVRAACSVRKPVHAARERGLVSTTTHVQSLYVRGNELLFLLQVKTVQMVCTTNFILVSQSHANSHPYLPTITFTIVWAWQHPPSSQSHLRSSTGS
jgi:hypothetical protein